MVAGEHGQPREHSMTTGAKQGRSRGICVGHWQESRERLEDSRGSASAGAMHPAFQAMGHCKAHCTGTRCWQEGPASPAAKAAAAHHQAIRGSPAAQDPVPAPSSAPCCAWPPAKRRLRPGRYKRTPRCTLPRLLPATFPRSPSLRSQTWRAGRASARRAGLRDFETQAGDAFGVLNNTDRD